MRSSERVVFAFDAPGEARQSAPLTERPNAVPSARQDFMWIGLMADIPDQPVARRVEQVMDGDREFDHAQSGAQVAAGHRDGVDHFLAEFVGKSRQLGLRQRAQICRRHDFVENRRLRSPCCPSLHSSPRSCRPVRLVASDAALFFDARISSPSAICRPVS